MTLLHVNRHAHTKFLQCVYRFFLQGQNLVLNMNDHGFVVCVYNRTTEKVDQFLANEAKGEQATPFCSAAY